MADDDKHGARVKARILDVGLDLWRFDPSTVSARRIGAALGLTHSAVLYHFGTSYGLRNAIAAHAVKTGDSKVIVQLIGQNHAAVAALSADDRAKHMRAIR